MTDVIDRAASVVELDDTERTAELARRRKAHDAAVARLAAEAPEARCCVDCGDAIGLKRLKAEPAATRCRFCQEQAEREGYP